MKKQYTTVAIEVETYKRLTRVKAKTGLTFGRILKKFLDTWENKKEIFK